MKRFTMKYFMGFGSFCAFIGGAIAHTRNDNSSAIFQVLVAIYIISLADLEVE